MSFEFHNKSYVNDIDNEKTNVPDKNLASTERWKEKKSRTKKPISITKSKDKMPVDVESSKAFQDLITAATTINAINKWKGMSTKRREMKKQRKSVPDDNDASETCILSTDIRASLISKKRDATDSTISDAQKKIKTEKDNSLIQYFAKISSPQNWEDHIDLEYVALILQEGADINATDAYGQTILHEVARTWNVDVASYLINCGADVNACDYMLRTPLHVAAAVNYPEMCQFLIKAGAGKEALTDSQQTPVFFAAKNDATQALKCLIKHDCLFDEVYDYRGRTPLYVAAELDRSETAMYLIELGADAFVQDQTSQIAFVPMVEKMPSVAKRALDQLHVASRAQRKQRFRLYNLDPIKSNNFRLENLETKKETMNSNRSQKLFLTDEDKKHIDEREYFSALKTITEIKNYPLIRNNVVKEFINVQWVKFARPRAIREIVLQFLLIFLWTAFAVIKEWTERYYYNFQNNSEWYRVFILLLGVLLTLYNIGDELREFYGEKKRHQRRVEWKKSLIDRDLKYCHARWPEEKSYLIGEKKLIENSTVSYFEDWWNYLDWACYIILLASLVTHLIDVFYPGGKGNLPVARWHVRIMAVNIILLWIRLLKFIKPFEFFGPFIVMLALIMDDVIKFLLLYIEFFIPFACAFWIIMGGEKNLPESAVTKYQTYENYMAETNGSISVTVDDFAQIHDMVFQLFRLTLVDEYDYKNMMIIDNVTCQILLGMWFAISTILFLNLFIAQLSETFKAVYDNAKAAASMQKAMTIVAYYDNMLLRYKIKFHQHVLLACNPKYSEYDDDATDDTSQEELSKATLQMRETINDLKQKFDILYELETNEMDNYDPEGSKNMSKTKILAEESKKKLEEVHNNQVKMSAELTQMRDDINSMKALLHDIAIVIAGGQSDEDEEAPQTDSNSRDKRKKNKRQRSQKPDSPARVINVQPQLPQLPLNNSRFNMDM